MARQFFSGNSIEQAVLSAARHYEIEPESVAYKVREKKHGFINLRRRVVIEVDPEAPKLPESKAAQKLQDSGLADSEKLSGPAIPRQQRGEMPVGGIVAQGEEATGGRTDSASDGDGEAEDLDSSDLDEGREYDEDHEVDEHRPSDGGRGGRPSREGHQERGDRGRNRGGRGGWDRGRGGSDRGDSGRADRGRGRRGRGDRQSETKIVEHFWEGSDWNEMDLEEGVSKELGAFELAVEKVLDVMDLDIEYTIEEGEVFEIDFSGEDEDILTDDDGKVLKAIEHILPRAARTLIGKAIPCRVDCNGFQAEHEEHLMVLAKEAAEEVLDSGRSRLLPPMTPADRRIVHLALVDNPEVDTSSEGSGYMKRVRVISVEEDDY